VEIIENFRLHCTLSERFDHANAFSECSIYRNLNLQKSECHCPLYSAERLSPQPDLTVSSCTQRSSAHRWLLIQQIPAEIISKTIKGSVGQEWDLRPPHIAE
jgi:hypothetical protein